MSLLDLILDNKIIVISVAAALAPLLIALILLVVQRVRKLLRQRAQHRAAAEAALAAQLQGLDARNQLDSVDLMQPVPEMALDATADGAAEEETPEAGDSSEAQGEGSSSEIQDLLASVFADDGVAAHYELLLSGTEPVDIHDLAEHCRSVADQLRARIGAQGA